MKPVNEKLVLQALETLLDGGEAVTFEAIGLEAGLDQRTLAETWSALLLKGHVELRPRLTNMGRAAVGRRAA